MKNNCKTQEKYFNYDRNCHVLYDKIEVFNNWIRKRDKMNRCLYNNKFEKFLNTEDNFVFGQLCDNYHGEALTTTREAWKTEITIMKEILSGLSDKNGDIIFEYDIPRLGKRIDVLYFALNLR